MIYTDQISLKNKINAARKKGSTVGLVPTMGALHEGHLSLVQKALDQNDLVVVSVFVNPTQFDNPSDLEKYPRTLEADEALLNTLKGNILIYAPSPKDLYGTKVVSKKYSFGGLEHQMEGRFRQGHFDGVGTVVNLLLRAAMPNRAYFGEKDFQQLQIIRKLVEIEKLPIEVVGCAIMRESNGVAMSSRNKRLSEKQLDEARVISKALQLVRKNFSKKSIAQLHRMVSQLFEENDYLTLEYFEVASIKNLKTAQRKRKENTYRGFIAAYCGEVRLIDNMALN